MRTFIGAVVGPGTRLNGIYEIEHLAAAGGTGEVYRARAIQTGDAVAIKMLRPAMARDDRALARFRKEATALRSLRHEAIVRYYVFSVDPTLGAPYLAMEFVDGRPLAELLKGGPLGFEAVRVLQRRLAEGLQAAHELGIVHRDLSPDNVLLPDGDVARAKIVDFGIARSKSPDETTIVGSAFADRHLYASPEQLGLHGGDVGPKSDIYSLGLVLAQALAGRALDMGGSPAERVEKRRKVPDLAGVDRRMRPLLRRMLQPNPADRLESMAEVAAWQPSGWPPARRAVPVAAGALAAAALVAAAVLVRPGDDSRGCRPAAGQHGRHSRDPGRVQHRGRGTGPRGGVSGAAPGGAEPAGDGAGSSSSGSPRRNSGSGARDPYPRLQARMPRSCDAALGDDQAGACVHLVPQGASGSDPQSDALALRPDPSPTSCKPSRQAHGLEPRLAAPQCSAVAFLRSLTPKQAGSLRLTLGATRLAPGEGLSGTVEGHGDRSLALLLVAEDGRVHNLSDDLRTSGGTAGFSTRIDGTSGRRLAAPAGPRPRERPRPSRCRMRACRSRAMICSRGCSRRSGTAEPRSISRSGTSRSKVSLPVSCAPGRRPRPGP